MGSSFCKIILTTAAFPALSMIFTVDAQHFSRPKYRRTIEMWGTQRGSVDYSFDYRVPDRNHIGSISCGFVGGVTMVRKGGARRAIVLNGNERKVEIVRDHTGSQLVVRYKDLRLSDGWNSFQCYLMYNTYMYSSGLYKLRIVEPKKMRITINDCLKVGATKKGSELVFELNEGDALISTCIISGYPVPYLQCSLVNNNNQVVNGAITKREQRNFIAADRKRLRLDNVRRAATRIKCIMDGGPPSRKTQVVRNVVVAYIPGAPENLQAISITRESIKCRWTAPRDTGRSKIVGYQINVASRHGTQSSKATANLEYTFSNLKMDTSYVVSVTAYNKVGQGRVMKATFKTSGNKTGSSVGAIVGGCIGGIIAVIIVVTLSWFGLKKRFERRMAMEGQAGTAATPQAPVENKGENAPGSTAMPSDVKTKSFRNPFGAKAEKSKKKEKSAKKSPGGSKEKKSKKTKEKKEKSAKKSPGDSKKKKSKKTKEKKEKLKDQATPKAVAK